MKIEIESRESIKARATAPFPARTALISLTDSDKDFVALPNKPEYLLQLKFDDVSDDIFEEILGRQPTADEVVRLAQKFRLFNNEQANEIAAFATSILGKAEILICQCEYGQSRSAGLAAAVSQFLYGDGIEIFADKRYFPNKLVYKTALLALKLNKEERQNEHNP